MDTTEIALENRKHRLEVWKAVVSVLTPIVLVALTFVVNNAIQDRGAVLKREEQILGEKQRIYAELGRKLNVFFVYAADVGDYRVYTPVRILEMKREADRQFFMYRPYWSESTEKHYDEYMRAAFRTYTGSGRPAQIKASKREKVAAYEVDNLRWDPTWNDYFTEEPDVAIAAKYDALVSSMLSDTVSAGLRKAKH